MQVRALVVATAMSAAALGGIAAAVPANAAPPSPTALLTATPSTDLTDHQVVSVSTTSGFEPNSSVFLAQCTPAIASSGSNADCDASTLVVAKTDANGGFTTNFPVVDGKDYKDSDKGTCNSTSDPGCVIIAVDSIDPTQVMDNGDALITFAPAVTSTTTAKASTKTVKSGKSFKLAVTTKGASTNGSYAGTVTVKANGKKVGSFNESKSGTASHKFTVKAKKTEKLKLVATYNGNGNYDKSSSKTVTVKVVVKKPSHKKK